MSARWLRNILAGVASVFSKPQQIPTPDPFNPNVPNPVPPHVPGKKVPARPELEPPEGGYKERPGDFEPIDTDVDGRPLNTYLPPPV